MERVMRSVLWDKYARKGRLVYGLTPARLLTSVIARMSDWRSCKKLSAGAQLRLTSHAIMLADTRERTICISSTARLRRTRASSLTTQMVLRQVFIAQVTVGRAAYCEEKSTIMKPPKGYDACVRMSK
jgi:hypothetical protein